ncbi:hypothetical protein NMG60_11026305 [Bertholletia excelsa]
MPNLKISGENSAASPCRVGFRPPGAFAATAERARTTTECLRVQSSSASLYEVLGISMEASVPEIKAAYRKLARICHPDVAAIDGRKESSADEFMRIHVAYSTLSDPEKRADYDRKLFLRHRPATVRSGLAGYTRRNWETDQCW